MIQRDTSKSLFLICLGVLIVSLYSCSHTSIKCGKYHLLKDTTQMTIDTVITFDPEDYSEELWVGKSYRTELLKYTCIEITNDGRKRRNFAEIDGKLFLISEFDLIHQTKGMKAGEKTE